jgi:hypothetical protein
MWLQHLCAGERGGTWQQDTGTLKVALQQTLVPTTGSVTLKFVLRNAAAAQTTSPVPKIGMVGVIPQALDGSVLGAGGLALITSVVVEESGRVVKQENTLTFRVKSNVPLMQGIFLTVSGLAGRLEACQDSNGDHTIVDITPATITLPQLSINFEGTPQKVQSDTNDALVRGNGTQSSLCINTDGTLSVQIPASVISGDELVFSFIVYNWASKLRGTSPTVAASGCIAPLTLSGSIAAVCDSTKGMTLHPTAAAETILSSGQEPQIVSLSVTEFTPVIAQPNRVYVEMHLSFRMENNTQLVLTGLGNAQQMSESAASMLVCLEIAPHGIELQAASHSVL